MNEKKQVNGNGMLTRALALKPQTANREELSVDAVIASETPALMYDWQRGEVDEILLMSGVNHPEQVPTLNAHNRGDVRDVIGATRNIRVEESELVATVFFSEDDLGRSTFDKVEGGILTDFSIGYNVGVATYIEPGERAEILGREFEASEDRALKVAKSWTLKENSVVPIGADVTAKVRAEETIKETQVEAVEPQKFSEERKEQMADEKKTEEVAPVDLEQIKAEGARAERERVAEIRACADGLNIDNEIVENCISEGKSVEDARSILLDALRKSANAPVPPAVHTREKQTGPEVIEAALMVRGNLEDQAVKSYGEETVEAGRDLRHASMKDIMKWGLRQAGETVSDFTGDRDLIRKNFELYKRGNAFSTMSLPYVLGNIANKSAMMGYTELTETWQQWVKEVSVSDFKTNTFVRSTLGTGLSKVGPGGEIRHGGGDEEYETGRAYTWGEMLAITREQIVNDDLNAFTNTPRELGRDARIKVGDEVYRLLISNGTLSDGYTLVGTDHSNYISGTDTAMTTTYAVDALSAAVVRFMQLKDKGGKRINVRPEMLLVPPELEAVAAAVFQSEYILGATTAKTPDSNIHRGQYRVVTEPRLSDTTFNSSASTTAWYLVAPKAMSDSIALMWLNGMNTPTVERGDASFDTLGIQYRVYLDFGAMYMGYRGIVGSKGAA